MCFFAETVGWRAPASVDDEVGGFKGWVGGEMVVDGRRRRPSQAKVESCCVVEERAGARQGQRRRRGEAREIEEARSKHARLILGNPSQAQPEHQVALAAVPW